MKQDNSDPVFRNLLIAIGSSAGGYLEVVKIISALPEHFQASVVLASHRNPDLANTLVAALANKAKIEVVEPFNDEGLQCTNIYVGAPNQRVEVEGTSFEVNVDTTDYSRIHRIDDLFESVARSAGENAVGIVLSGLLSDGVAGLKAINDAGGICIVQDPEDADYGTLPENVLKQVNAHFVGSSEDIAELLVALASVRTCINPTSDPSSDKASNENPSDENPLGEQC